MSSINNLLNENWAAQLQIRKLIWDSEYKFWRSISSIKEYITSRKKKYVPTHRYN